MKEITFRFEDDKLAKHFLGWLANSGEQEFMVQMSDYEQIDVCFDYWIANSNQTFGPIVVCSYYKKKCVDG